MKLTKFKDIPQFTSDGCYQCNYPLTSLVKYIEEEVETMGLQLNPDFQRGHVWTEEQQIAWLEYHLRGGKSGNTIYLNNPFWHNVLPPKQNDYTDYVSESYPISYYKDYIKNSNTFYKNVKGVKTSLKVEGNKIIYEVDIQYSQEDMMFGPVLRKNKNELFIRYWQKQYQTYLKIMKDLPSNHPRYLELENQKHLIEGELNESL